MCAYDYICLAACACSNGTYLHACIQTCHACIHMNSCIWMCYACMHKNLLRWKSCISKHVHISVSSVTGSPQTLQLYYETVLPYSKPASKFCINIQTDWFMCPMSQVRLSIREIWYKHILHEQACIKYLQQKHTSVDWFMPPLLQVRLKIRNFMIKIGSIGTARTMGTVSGVCVCVCVCLCMLYMFKVCMLLSIYTYI
jgi:hypothetical protein